MKLLLRLGLAFMTAAILPSNLKAQQADSAVVNPLYRLATQAYQKGDMVQCIALLDSLIEVCETYGDYHRYVVYSLYNGWNYSNALRDTENANRYASQAIQAVETKMGGHHVFLYDVYGLLAGLASDIGDYEKAFEYHLKAEQVALEMDGPHSFGVMASNTNLGNLYVTLQEYDQALTCLHRARKVGLYQLPTDSTGIWASRILIVDNRLLRLYLSMDQMDSARVLAARCQEWLDIHDPQFQNGSSPDLVHGLMDFYQSAGEEARAWEYLLHLDTMYHRFPGPNSIQYALNQRTKASMYEFRDSLDAALRANSQAFLLLGASWESDGLTIQEAAADLRCQGCEPSLYEQRIALLLALAKEKEGPEATDYLASCVRTAELAIDQLASIRSTILFREGSKQRLFERYNKIYRLGSLAAWHLYERNQDSQTLAKSLWFSEQSKANLLRESLFVREIREQSPLPADVAATEKGHILNILRLEGLVENAYQARDSMAVRRLTQDSLFLARKEYESFLVELRKDYPLHTLLQREAEVASLTELQDQLSSGQRIINYLAQPEEDLLQVTVIGPHEAQVKLLPWGEEDEKLLHSYLRNLNKVSLVQTRRRLRFIEQSHALYQKLIAPLVSELPQGSHLTILPDGNLSQLPFESLLQESADRPFEQMPFLIKAFPVSYHYAGSIWLEGAKSHPSESEGLYAFAPVFSNQEELTLSSRTRGLIEAEAFLEAPGAWAPLPFTRTEVKEIGKLFPAQVAITVTDEEASEAELKQSLEGDYRYLHLASHSFVNRQNPHFSGIACAASPEDEAEDGILFASEIFAMTIQANLVTLSSCESGVGPLLAGEGMLGLNRSFLQAGVPNVLFSLWKVDDRATSQLMIPFYRELITGKPYAQALQTAKLSLLQASETALPAYWAAFMLIGVN